MITIPPLIAKLRVSVRVVGTSLSALAYTCWSMNPDASESLSVFDDEVVLLDLLKVGVVLHYDVCGDLGDLPSLRKFINLLPVFL